MSDNQPTPQQIIEQLQNQIAQLQNNLHSVQQQALNIASANANSNANFANSVLKIAKPEKFYGKNARMWIKSLQNIIDAQNSQISEHDKIKYAVSFLTGDGLQWWELVNINPEININTFQEFCDKLLEYFEPVNREFNARKAMNSLKQMGKFSKIRDYNKKFTEYLLQVPSMTIDEQLFHYTQGLKNKIRIELERSEVESLHVAMRLADRMDCLYQSNNPSPYEFPHDRFQNPNNPTPMEIGQIPIANKEDKTQNGYKRLSPEEKKKRMEENRCFVCNKIGCRARNHRKN